MNRLLTAAFVALLSLHVVPCFSEDKRKAQLAELTAYLPQDAAFVGYCDMTGVFASPFGKEILDLINELERGGSMAGMSDLLNDIDMIVIGSTSVSRDTENLTVDMFSAVVQGRVSKWNQNATKVGMVNGRPVYFEPVPAGFVAR